MKTVQIEGFTIETNLDEQDVFQRMLAISGYTPDDTKVVISEIETELQAANIVDFIEKVGIDDMPISSYFYENCRGYHKRYLEPFNWRANKKSITISYTGAQGGMPWYAKVFLS